MGYNYQSSKWYEESYGILNKDYVKISKRKNSLKEGSRKEVCSKQREAARLGLLANKSLIKAFDIDGTEPPMNEIKASQQRWESILNEC